MSIGPPIPVATRRLLERADWERLWLQGLVWARREARRHPGLPPMEREIVQTAIEKTFSGERTWKPETCDLAHHIRMTVRSLYSSETKKLRSRQDYRRLERAGAAETGNGARAQERLDELRAVVRLLRDAAPDLADFFLEASRLLLEGCDTEAEVAAAMGLSPVQFSRRKSRIAALVAAERGGPGRIEERQA